MLSGFQLFGHLGDITEVDEGLLPPQNGYVTESAAAYYVAEDGVTFYVQEN